MSIKHNKTGNKYITQDNPKSGITECVNMYMCSLCANAVATFPPCHGGVWSFQVYATQNVGIQTHLKARNIPTDGNKSRRLTTLQAKPTYKIVS